MNYKQLEKLHFWMIFQIKLFETSENIPIYPVLL